MKRAACATASLVCLYLATVSGWPALFLCLAFCWAYEAW